MSHKKLKCKADSVKATSFPFFSVIIPTYNRWIRLQKAIKSALNQQFSNIEVIVVNDGSTDETHNQLVLWQQEEPRLKVITQANLGVSSARNAGIFTAKAPWLAFLDSDDEWNSDKLTMFFEYIQNHAELKIIHSNELWIRNNKPVKQHFTRSGGEIFKDCLKRCCIGPSTVVIHKDVFTKVGVFRPDFVVCEDYDLWLRISSCFKVGFIEASLVIKHGHDNQLSLKHHSLDLWRLKALSFQLWNPRLSLNEKNLVKEEIRLKSHILLKGFEKYQNFKDQNTVHSIQASLDL